uniref:F-box domain-containing protein n=1 Tax=Hanusia phi TaxID=3032 RepID=A0A7S0E6W5_9CRYP|mmetsp:Transcript_18084/g.41032  ORF Transcript_18084/g.41032 Transcript_18084/m.41032 type:complete len:480 (+) Transcript_18084:85-1524(+)
MSWAVLRYLRTPGVVGFQPLPLFDLDDEILLRIMENLSPKFLLRTVSTVNKRLLMLADDDMLWQQKIRELPWQVNEKLVAAWFRNLGSNKRVFRLLSQVGWLHGYWVLDNKPRGGMLRVEIREADIVVSLMIPHLDGLDPMEVQPIRKFDMITPFTLAVEPSGLVLVTCGNTLAAKDFFGFTGASNLDIQARVNIFTRGSSGSLFCKLVGRGDMKHSYLCHESSPLRQEVAVAPKRTRDMRRRTGYMQDHYSSPAYSTGALMLCKNSSTVPRPVIKDPSDFDPRELQGLWRGAYGPHGTELICVSVCNLISSRFTELVGLKCTGDPNVPSGELTFRAPLNCDAPLVSDASNPGMLPVPGMPNGLRKMYHCTCSFHCDCPRTCRGSRDDAIPVKAVYDGLALVAEHGFVNPTWNSGMVVVLDDNSGDMLLVWKGLFSVRFQRMNDDSWAQYIYENVDVANRQCHETLEVAAALDAMDIDN